MLKKQLQAFFKIAIALLTIAFFSNGVNVWYLEFYNGEKLLPGKVVKHVNKEVQIKHGTQTEFHLIVDFAQYGRHDLNVTTACYFDTIDGKTYHWKKNPKQLDNSMQDGWVTVGFFGLLIVAGFCVYFIVKFLSWVFDFKLDFE